MVTLGRVLSLAVPALMLSGCLVTDEIQFPQDVPYPPTIVGVPGAEFQIATIIWIDLKGHAQNEWKLPVRIRDDNVDQTLEARYRVLQPGEPSPRWARDEIAPSGSPVREDYEVKVRFGDLLPGECHRVELVVSGSFLRRTENKFFDVLNDEGEASGDIARASWTILEGDPSDPEIEKKKALLLDSCKAIESLFQEAAP